MKKVITLILALAMIFALAACGASTETTPATSSETTGNTATETTEATAEPVEDDTVYTIKMSTQLSEGSPFVDGFYAWSEAVKEKTNGHVVIEVYTSAALGSDEDVIEQALEGVNVAVLTDCGRMGNYVPDMGILLTAYFADSLDEMNKVMQTDTFKGWCDQLESEHGIKILNFGWCDGFRNFLTNKPIYSPEDLQGLLIRTPGAAAFSKSIASFGATVVSTVGWADVYNSVQSKVIDGAEGQTSAVYPAALYEVLSYLSKTQHFLLMNGIIVGQKFWDTIPAEYQDIIIEECATAAANASQAVADNADAYEAEMVEQGMTIIPPEEIDIAAFRACADEAYEELGFTELRAQLYQEIGKN